MRVSKSMTILLNTVCPVLLDRPKKQVVGIYAGPNVAFVANKHPRWDGPLVYFI